MTTKIDYRLPTALMALMLLSIIFVVVIYPATTYKLENPNFNPKLAGDYRERKDYTDLQWVGRRIYISEGCFYCHSQQARFQDRGLGPTAYPQEFQFDNPHLLGSARTGPDLSREGGKYPSRWHREHHINPRDKYSGSIMPSFRHLDDQPLELDSEVGDPEGLLALHPSELWRAMRGGAPEAGSAVGVAQAQTDRRLTPEEAVYELRAIGYTDYDLIKPDRRGVTRLDALVAYMQSLGTSRMYEPGQQIPSALPATLPRVAGYQPAAGEALPAEIEAPVDWRALAVKASEYWVPTEYQELAKKAKEEGKIPAFEPRFVAMGRGLYLGKCAHCHGLNGQGNGPAGKYMEKKPANFWLPQFKLYSDAMWFYRIAEGIPGTQMPVWKLSLRQRKKHSRWDQIWYLVVYLKYVAAQSPMQPAPSDLPPEFYLTDNERARQATFPVDIELIKAKIAAGQATAPEGEAPAADAAPAPAAAGP